jgi:hypothetical protein
MTTEFPLNDQLLVWRRIKKVQNKTALSTKHELLLGGTKIEIPSDQNNTSGTKGEKTHKTG